jgi:hypothetical protein
MPDDANYPDKVAYVRNKAENGSLLSSDATYQFLLGKTNLDDIATFIAKIESKVKD